MDSKAVNIHHAVIERCRKSDRKAQYELYRLYYKAMYNTAYRMLGDGDDAQDVLQESFVSAFDHLDQYRGESAFGAWLKRIVINKTLNHLKRKNRWEELEAGESYEEPYYEWEEVPDHHMTVKEIKDAVTMLPSGFRSVLTLYLFEGYDHKEIGEILNISESTSKSQFNRAKKKLRGYLNKEVKYG